MSEAQTLDDAPTPPGLDPGLRIRLSIMMFIQYAAWGAWWSVLSIYLGEIDFKPEQVGDVYATVAIASIIMPLLIGQLADRWVPTQYLLSALFLAGAAALYAVTQYTEFATFYWLVLVWALLYVPTITLTNSLSFHHVPDAAKYFPGIRVFGTIGWIVSGVFVGFNLDDTTAQPIYLACILSAVMGVYCLLLPHTPAPGKGGDLLPFVKALGLLRNKAFALFILVSFCTSVVLAGYFTFAGQFLKHIEMPNIAAVMTVGQVTEMILLPFLPFFLKHLGMKRTLALGMAAWGVRYAIFGIGHPPWFIIGGIALHGICYDFFFVAAYIHVDNQADKTMRASAQALFNIVTMGLGMWLGNKIFGQLVAYCTDADTEIVDWTTVWTWPAVGVVVCLIIFYLGFKEQKQPA